MTSWEIVIIIQVREDDDFIQSGSGGSSEKGVDYVYIFESGADKIC